MKFFINLTVILFFANYKCINCHNSFDEKDEKYNPSHSHKHKEKINLTINQSATFSHLNYDRRIDSELTEEISRRIVGGVKANVSNFPFHVLITIYHPYEGRTRVQLCGGSIISRKLILTAAHCMVLASSKVTVHVSKNKIRSDGLVYEVEKLIVHPKYDKVTNCNDIGIMKLRRSLQYSRNVRNVFLPRKDGNYDDVKLVRVMGFGATSFSRTTASPNPFLLTTTLTLFSDNYCEAKWGKEIYKRKKMLCAGAKGGGKDTCTGDSGSPMVALRRNNYYIVLGITSFGHECGKSIAPGIYVRVQFYLKWILKMMKEHK